MLFPAPLLQAITDGFDAAIYAKDKDLRFAYVNPYLAALSDSKVEQVIGKKDSDFMSLEDCDKVNSADKRVISQKRPEILIHIIEINGMNYKIIDHKFPIDINGSNGVAGICFLTPA